MGDSLKYIGLGEETDAYQRAWQVKPSGRFLFLPELWVNHWVPPWKMSLSYRLKRLFFSGFYDYQISGPNSFFPRLSYIFWITFDLLKTSVKAGLAIWKYSHWKKWAYCEISPLAINLGKIYGTIGFKLSREDK